MHQQQRNQQSSERHLSAKWESTFMPVSDSALPNVIANDNNITRLCIKRTS